MNVVGRIRVIEIAGTAVLAGAAPGSAWFKLARERIDASKQGAHLVDFVDVKLATVSWLREAVVALQRYAFEFCPGVVIIAANLEELVREELVVALAASASVIIAADTTSDDQIQRAVVLGRLDTALNDTLRVVLSKSEFDAAFVAKALSPVKLSAANNRLAALERKRLLQSERRGRARVYRPIVENLSYGY